MLAAAVLVAAGDTPRAAGRVTAGFAAVSGPASAALPRFALFGWVSPPRESTTAGRYAELAAAGFNLTVLAWADSEFASDNAARLAFTRPYGVRNLLADRMLADVRAAVPESLAFADTVVARYRDDPAFLGYYLGDEPSAADFPRLGVLFAVLRARDPVHPAWNNLLGRAAFPDVAAFRDYLERYVAATSPTVLCDDHYEFQASGDRGQMAENIGTLASVARAHGLPFWGIVLLTRHLQYRDVTAGMLRWQAAQWLAWGARGIGVFTYWTPAPDPVYDWQPAMIGWDGARTAAYDTVRVLNADLSAVGNVLAGARWLATTYAGSVPVGGTAFAPGSLVASVTGRATLGWFADSLGRPLLFVGNADSLAARTLGLELGPGRSAERLRDDGSGWEAASAGASVTLGLPSGGFALLRLSGFVDDVAGGASPGLSVGPNPARGAVRFAPARIAPGARLELLDLAGRRIWEHLFSPGEGTVEWRGVRADGSTVRAGVYFARLEDARGVVVRRVTWLGP